MILNHFGSGLKMKSVQQENEPRRVGSILYFSQKSCQKVIFFHFLSYPFYYVVITLVHHGTTGLARSLIAHCFYLQIFLRPFYKVNLILKSFQDWFLAFQLSIVSPLCLRTLVENTMSFQRHETWNWKSIRILFIVGCLCCCHSVIHLWAKISLISLCGRDFQNVPTPKTD